MWTTIAAIGSVNFTWQTLEMLPGSSTTPYTAIEKPMIKMSVEKKQND